VGNEVNKPRDWWEVDIIEKHLSPVYHRQEEETGSTHWSASGNDGSEKEKIPSVRDPPRGKAKDEKKKKT